LNGCDDVTAIRVEPDVFQDFDSAQSKFFAQPKDINVNHIFTVHIDQPTLLLKHEFYGGLQTQQELLLPAKVGTKWMNDIYNETEIEEAPGMKDIKWIELFSKIGKYVPEEKKALWAPYHTDPGAVRKEKVNLQSKQSKRQRKERTTTK
jgi:hypothetical protein